jgi:hypothetical protein
MQVYSNNDKLNDTIPIFCTARIPAEVRPRSLKLPKLQPLTLTPPQLLNEFFTEAFEAKELKNEGCTHIGKKTALDWCTSLILS